MQPLHPHSEVIDRMGGSTEVARLCRIRPQAVSQWRRYGIPQAREDFLRLVKPGAFAEQRTPVSAEQNTA
jgi:hypothetical protein